MKSRNYTYYKGKIHILYRLKPKPVTIIYRKRRSMRGKWIIKAYEGFGKYWYRINSHEFSSGCPGGVTEITAKEAKRIYKHIPIS